MIKRLLARLSLVVVALTLVAGVCGTVLTSAAPETAGDSSEFILRAPADRIAAIAARHGLMIVRPVEGHPEVYLVKPIQTITHTASAQSVDDPPDPTAQLTQDILADPEVLHFEVNGSARLAETQASPHLNESTVAILDSITNRTLTGYFGNSVWSAFVAQPATAIIHLPQAQALATGSGVVVAIIDTGVDPHHPALQGILVPGYDFTRDTAGPASEWADLDESTVAILDSATASILDPSAPVALNESTVAILDSATTSSIDVTQLPHAFGHGTMVAGLVHMVAPTSGIMPLKAFKADGSSNLFDIERAIYYAVDHGAKVINMSFSMDVPSPEITHAIDYASEHGVICVASAGNAARSAVEFPAGFRDVLGVGSTTLTDERSTFSNYGNHLVRFAAPGESLITIYPGRRYAGVAGTSFSTGIVSGAAAVLAQLEPTVDQRLAGRYLDDGALKKPDWQLGDGRINLYETLRTHTSTITPPPPPPPADTTAPTVSVTSPSNGATVTGFFTVTADALDDVGVAGVQFTLDGANFGDEDTAAPYQLAWNSVTVPNGAHVLAAVARDAAGNQQIAASVSVTIANDTTAPTAAMTSPAEGATVAGTTTLTVSASDDVGVAGVQFTLDGVNLGPQLSAAPYTLAWNSATASNGAHVLSAIAHDAAGNLGTTVNVHVTVANDTTAPTVTIGSPSDGATVTGTVSVTASASDNVGVAGVQFTVDGVNAGSEQTASPYTLSWNSGTASNGSHVVAAIARDAAGNHETASITVTVANDTTAPTVTIGSPTDGATIGGVVTFAASASDNVAVAGVQFAVDGVNLGSEHVTSPYTVSWDSVTVANGTHVLAATARDAAGNQRTVTVSVTVANDTTLPTVAIADPEDGATFGGSLLVKAIASDNVGVAGVQFTIDGVNLGAEDTVAPYEVSWNTGAVANGSHVVAAIARDAAGNQRTASVTVTVFNDTTAPTVTVTSPANGAVVSGTIAFAVNAADNVGVAGVQFTLDGVNVGGEDQAAPYEFGWNSGTVPNGIHVLAAVARDAAGNQRTASVTVTVANDTIAPLVVLTSPAEGAAISGVVTIEAAASDNVGVAGVQFTLDGVNLGAERVETPYTLQWDSATASNGVHVLTATARDPSGNHQTATIVTVIVTNITPPQP